MAHVSRSTYQKVVEENKRLLKDIRLLVQDGMPSSEKVMCIKRYRDKFKKENNFNIMMHQLAKLYIQEHADELPEFLVESIKNVE